MHVTFTVPTSSTATWLVMLCRGSADDALEEQGRKNSTYTPSPPYIVATDELNYFRNAVRGQREVQTTEGPEDVSIAPRCELWHGKPFNERPRKACSLDDMLDAGIAELISFACH